MSSPSRYWIAHDSCLLHDMGAGHPERPARLAAIEDGMRRAGLDRRMIRAEAPAATTEALLRVHDAGHVRSLMEAQPDGGLLRLDPDTAMNDHTLDAALHAAGAGALGIDLLLSGRADFVFCAVRPPGHHAERDRPMGFCFFNNVAVAVGEALARGLERVAVLDFDVHYGNGTSDIFGHEPRVRVFNTYQDPLYPYWPGAPQAASLIDVPLAPYSAGPAYRRAVAEHWLPALEAFAPQLLVVSAGFDAHALDPLAGLRLEDADYAWTGREIRSVANRHCEGRVLAMLEGGYDLQGLAGGVTAFVGAFLEG